MQRLFIETLKFAHDIDTKVNSALTQEQKEYLKQKQNRSLAEIFSTTEEDASQNKHNYRIAQAIGTKDPALFVATQPLNELLQQAENNYGQWTWGAYVKNILIHNDTLSAIDFNNPQYATPQTTDTYILDGYLPLKPFLGRNLHDENGTWRSPMIEQDRLELARDNFKHLPNTSTHPGDVYLATRIERNLRQLNYAMREAQKSRNPSTVYDAAEETALAIEQISIATDILAKRYPAFSPLKIYLDNFMRAKMLRIEPLWKNAIQSLSF
jgi:hypothetical protein